MRPAFRSPRPSRSVVAAFGLLALTALGAGAPPALGAGAAPAAAHEVPADVAVQGYVRPSEAVLTLLFRVPLEAMRDVEWPLDPDGYLDIPALEPFLREAAELWIAGYLDLYEDGERLPAPTLVDVRATLPSDRSFRSYEAALAHVRGTLSPDTRLVPGQALLDVLLEVPITSAAGRFEIDSGLAHLGVETRSVLHFLPADGSERVFQYEGNPGRVRLDPRWHQAAWTFVRSGFRHILGGYDHLLFVLCLVIPLRSVARLVPVVTAFTVAHSITLVAAALGMSPGGLWFPPLVETFIAASIVYMAVENIFGIGLGRRWMAAFGFGLVHGFGFSFVLRDSLQFGGSHLLTSLLAFNVGVEAGQLLVVAVAVPVLGWLFRRVPERLGVIVLSAFITHSAWHWMTARGAAALEYRVALPVMGPALMADLMRWAALALLCVGAAWGLARIFDLLERRPLNLTLREDLE